MYYLTHFMPHTATAYALFTALTLIAGLFFMVRNRLEEEAALEEFRLDDEQCDLHESQMQAMELAYQEEVREQEEYDRRVGKALWESGEY